MREDAESAKPFPVVMATAKDAEIDKIQGLDLGADYYLTKPFGVMELVSCVQGGAAPLRAQAGGEAAAFRAGWLMNLDQHTVTVDGKRRRPDLQGV